MLMRSDVRFSSALCVQGYELVPLRGADPAKPSYADAMLLLELERLAAPPEWLTALAPKGPERRPLDPLRFDALFKFFADRPYDPESYRLFSNQWGLLSAAPTVGRLEPERGGHRRGGVRAATGRVNASSEQAAALPAATSSAARAKWSDVPPPQPRETQSTMSMAAFHSILRCALGLPTDAEPPFIRATTVPRVVGLPRAYSRDRAIAQLAVISKNGIKAMMEVDPAADLPILVIRPANLMTAISLQALKHLSGVDDRNGVKFVQCKQCSAYFKVGPGTGRRSTSEFCTRKCQDRHSYLARKQKNEAQR